MPLWNWVGSCVWLLKRLLQACQQQAKIKQLSQEVQAAAGTLEAQVRRWEGVCTQWCCKPLCALTRYTASAAAAGAAAKLDRSLRATGDVENLLASVEEDVATVARLLTQLAQQRRAAAGGSTDASPPAAT